MLKGVNETEFMEELTLKGVVNGLTNKIHIFSLAPDDKKLFENLKELPMCIDFKVEPGVNLSKIPKINDEEYKKEACPICHEQRLRRKKKAAARCVDDKLLILYVSLLTALKLNRAEEDEITAGACEKNKLSPIKGNHFTSLNPFHFYPFPKRASIPGRGLKGGFAPLLKHIGDFLPFLPRITPRSDRISHIEFYFHLHPSLFLV